MVQLVSVLQETELPQTQLILTQVFCPVLIEPPQKTDRSIIPSIIISAINIMDIELIIDIAMDKLMSDLCLKYYLEPSEERRKQIYDDEIMPLYKKINKIE